MYYNFSHYPARFPLPPQDRPEGGSPLLVNDSLPDGGQN
jgi:hypothetical protein